MHNVKANKDMLLIEKFRNDMPPQVAIIDKGSIVFQGTIEELRQLRGNKSLEQLFLEVTKSESEKVDFSLTKENPISEPFKSQFGWHIVKLIEKFPVKTLEEMQ